MIDIMKAVSYMDSEDVYELALEVLQGEIDGDIIRLLPFMDDDDISKITMYCVEHNIDIDYSAMVAFMDEKDVYKLVRLCIEHKLKLNVAEFVPYMDEDDVDKLCRQIANDPDFTSDLTLSDLYPYASESGADGLFLRYAAEGKFDEKALPYVSDKCLHELVSNYCKNPDWDVDIDALFPFLDSKDLSMLLKTYLKKRKGQ